MYIIEEDWEVFESLFEIFRDLESLGGMLGDLEMLRETFEDLGRLWETFQHFVRLKETLGDLFFFFFWRLIKTRGCLERIVKPCRDLRRLGETLGTLGELGGGLGWDLGDSGGLREIGGA